MFYGSLTCNGTTIFFSSELVHYYSLFGHVYLILCNPLKLFCSLRLFYFTLHPFFCLFFGKHHLQPTSVLKLKEDIVKGSTHIKKRWMQNRNNYLKIAELQEWVDIGFYIHEKKCGNKEVIMHRWSSFYSKLHRNIRYTLPPKGSNVTWFIKSEV